MDQREDTRVHGLRAIEERLATLDPEDPESLGLVGAALEQLVEAPEAGETDLLAEMLVLALQGLQRLYLKSAPHPLAVLGAVRHLIATGAQRAEACEPATSEAVCRARMDQLTELLGASEAEPEAGAPDTGADALSTPSPAPGAEAAEELTLDDLALRLIQLAPEDREGAQALHDGLRTLAERPETPARVQELAHRAAGRMEALLRGAPGEAEQLLAEVGNFIEAAANALADPEAAVAEAEPSAPPPRAAAAEPSAEAGDWALPADAEPALIGDFVTESREYIEGAEAALLSLETDPDDPEAVNTVFRSFHTIKGTAGFLGLTGIASLAHRAESLLSRVRDREIRFGGTCTDLSLRSVDTLKDLLHGVEEALSGRPIARPHGFDALMEGLTAAAAGGEPAGAPDIPAPLPRLGDLLVAQGAATRDAVEAAAQNQGEQPLGVSLLKSGAAELEDVAKALRTQQQRVANSEHGADSTVRVRTDRLDRLIEMVGELVIAQSMIAQDETALQGGHHELMRKITHGGKIVRELQDLTMSMRMVPLKATFQKIARLVRDLAQKTGKRVEFIAEGEDTEVDRNMFDFISDPLIHMIRNAVDHGIEAPEIREAAGKPRTGRVRLTASHAGGNVVVALQDDGRGLNREKIVAKAIDKGLIESDKSLSDGEVFNLVFSPGFSTADQVTDVSGRGVGMDVVRRNVEAMRGCVDIASTAGQGTLFSIRLPLTLAITDGMLVQVGDQRFIIPTVNIDRSFRPDAAALSTVAGRGEMVLLRDDLMPVFRLHRLFAIEGAANDPTEGILVIIGDHALRCAVLVDDLLGQQQVVAKSLGDGLAKIPGVAGAAILGDGCVGLILDPAGIATIARQAPAAGDVEQLLFGDPPSAGGWQGDRERGPALAAVV